MPHPEVLKVLLERGANPNQYFGDSTALLDPMLSGMDSDKPTYMQALTILLEFGADPNLADVATGNTALIGAAVDLRSLDLVRLLLEYGADVTQVNLEGKSVLDLLREEIEVGQDTEEYGEEYNEIFELCTQYIDCNRPGATPVLK